MIKVCSSNEMREMDRHTIETLGVPGTILMENAGVGTFRVIQNMLEDIPHPRVILFCGKGNNGGDGFVIARHLWDAAIEVQVAIIGSRDDLRGDAEINYTIMKNFGIPHFFVSKMNELKAKIDDEPDLMVDALLGTGIKGGARGFASEVIEYINQCNCPVVAVDVPSGLNADSPAIEGQAIKADITVTMGLPKRCHIFYPAKSHVGELYIADIGIPHTVRNNPDVKVQMVEQIDIQLPQRIPDTHKYQCGKVAVLAGSPGYTGAAVLSAEAALRIGGGMTILAIPEQLNPILETKLTEVITRPYPTGGDSHLTPHSMNALQELLEWCDVLAIGPGLGRTAETQEAIIQILSNFEKPAVIDADALFAVANHQQALQGEHYSWILTPHHGEFIRFLKDIDKNQLKTEFVSLSQQFTQDFKVNLLLKGSPSMVVDTEGYVFVNSTGNAGLASGGTGDVLTGMIAGLMAQGLTSIEAGYTASYLHGLIADEIIETNSLYSLAAGDLLQQMGAVLHKHFL